MFKTILVATDGSADSDRAFDVARSLATEQGAHLIAVHVTEFVGGKGGRYPATADEEELCARLAQDVDELTAAGVHAEFVNHFAHLTSPAHVISDLAESVSADVIVVGTRGRSPISELVLGSVPIRLLQIAHRPVLVVPRPATSHSSQ